MSLTLTGTCTTNGTAVTFSSGSSFTGAWALLAITINAVGYTVASVGSATALTLTGTAGVQASPVAFSITVPAGLGTGTCNTTSVSDAVTWVSGTTFEAGWVALIIEINGVNYTVSTVTSTTAMTLTTSPGIQTGVGFAIMEAGTINPLPVTKPVTEVITPLVVTKTRVNDAFNPTVSGGPNTSGVGQIFPTGRV